MALFSMADTFKEWDYVRNSRPLHTGRQGSGPETSKMNKRVSLPLEPMNGYSCSRYDPRVRVYFSHSYRTISSPGAVSFIKVWDISKPTLAPLDFVKPVIFVNLSLVDDLFCTTYHYASDCCEVLDLSPNAYPPMDHESTPWDLRIRKSHPTM
ncbi:hypothetical protein J6590_066186 [Homalodisca vitripennis]|nr:hypothetical protein J6590_066185 [Homalodisca vitripennis]KAG8281095.1 hypothetical protein J6590_066186 [Homalodisca vitripennis]